MQLPLANVARRSAYCQFMQRLFRRLLLGLFFGLPFAFTEYLTAYGYLRNKTFFMVRATFRNQTIAGRRMKQHWLIS